jgi:hypothetical protein
MALLLTILPAFVLAAPPWNKVEYVYSPKDTLAQTKIYADSAFIVEVEAYLTHQRGDDASTKSTHRWDYTPSGNLFEGDFPVTFETSMLPDIRFDETSADLKQPEKIGISGRPLSGFVILIGGCGLRYSPGFSVKNMPVIELASFLEPMELERAYQMEV